MVDCREKKISIWAHCCHDVCAFQLSNECQRIVTSELKWQTRPVTWFEYFHGIMPVFVCLHSAHTRRSYLGLALSHTLNFQPCVFFSISRTVLFSLLFKCSILLHFAYVQRDKFRIWLLVLRLYVLRAQVNVSHTTCWLCSNSFRSPAHMSYGVFCFQLELLHSWNVISVNLAIEFRCCSEFHFHLFYFLLPWPECGCLCVCVANGIFLLNFNG